MNYKIIVKGKAKVNSRHAVRDIDVDKLYEDGSDFVEYMSEGSLKDSFREPAYMTFVKEDRSLYVVVEYMSCRRLDQKELDKLMDYTVGQWSDGIGEGFEQNPCGELHGEDVYISPWNPDQKATIDQVEMPN